MERAIRINRRRLVSMLVLIATFVINLDQQVMVGSTQDLRVTNQNQSTTMTRTGNVFNRSLGTDNQSKQIPAPTPSIGANENLKSAETDKTPIGPTSKLMNPIATNYLQKYGYMNSTKELGGVISPKVFSEAMIKFQHSMGLKETGIADEESLKMMAKPRCGNTDEPKKIDKALRKKIPRRRKREDSPIVVTYKVSKYPSNFNKTQEQVDEQIRKATSEWSKATPVDFVAKSDGDTNLDIKFNDANVDDKEVISGSLKEKSKDGANSFSESLELNSDNWTVDSQQGRDIYHAIVHELGHKLGLQHSEEPGSVMSATYAYKPALEEGALTTAHTLNTHDVKAIQQLYGKRG